MPKRKTDTTLSDEKESRCTDQMKQKWRDDEHVAKSRRMADVKMESRHKADAQTAEAVRRTEFGFEVRKVYEKN